MPQEIVDAITIFGYWASRPVDISLPRLLEILDKHGITRSACVSTTGMFFDAESGNDETWAAVEANPSLIPVATVDPRRGRGCGAEIERRAGQGFRMFSLFPETQGWELDSALFGALRPALSAAARPVMVEASDPGDPSRIARAAEGTTFPIILAGVNYATLAEAVAVMQADPRVYLETHTLTAVDSIDLVASEVGADRLLFGSYSPLNYASSSLLMVQYCGLGDAEKAAILGGNLLRLLEAT
jgi:predicted TIM-barrel fold metal-dependent hydrolase